MIDFGELRRQDLALLSGALTMICVVPYVCDIYRGTTRPQRVSWFVFAALSIIAAVSQFATGDVAGAWLASGSALGFTVVFVASIGRGEGGSSRRDGLSLIVAICGVVVSIVSGRPVVAVVAVVGVELSAIALTARKAVRDPASETMSTWLVDGLAGVVAIAAVTELSVPAVLYPVHHTCVNAWVAAAIAHGRRRHRLTIGASATSASRRSPAA